MQEICNIASGNSFATVVTGVNKLRPFLCFTNNYEISCDIIKWNLKQNSTCCASLFETHFISGRVLCEHKLI
jgi:hypothetical protein